MPALFTTTSSARRLEGVEEEAVHVGSARHVRRDRDRAAVRGVDLGHQLLGPRRVAGVGRPPTREAIAGQSQGHPRPMPPEAPVTIATLPDEPLIRVSSPASFFRGRRARGGGPPAIVSARTRQAARPATLACVVSSTCHERDG